MEREIIKFGENNVPFWGEEHRRRKGRKWCDIANLHYALYFTFNDASTEHYRVKSSARIYHMTADEIFDECIELAEYPNRGSVFDKYDFSQLGINKTIARVRAVFC